MPLMPGHILGDEKESVTSSLLVQPLNQKSNHEVSLETADRT